MANAPIRIRMEDLLTSKVGFGLTTASPVQRAFCKIVDGEPLGELQKHPHVVATLGTDSFCLDGPPFEILLLAAIRGGKSKMAACLSVRNALTCDLSKVTTGDEVRSSIVSVTRDLATPIISHVKGGLLGSQQLRSLMIGDPTADAVRVRHPTGRPVEICVASGSRAGSSLVARYSAGCVFDESARMVGADEGVANYDNLREAVIGRVVDGALLVSISSPWAPEGPVYDIFTEHFGKPTRDMVVMRARGDHINPVFWTPKRIADLKRRNPLAYRTDFLAEFAEQETSLFSQDEVMTASSRTEMVLPRDPMCEYAAAMDPGTRSNSWTLVLATKKGGKFVIPIVRQWTGSKVQPLNTKDTIKDIATVLHQYGIDIVQTDQWSTDFIRDMMREHGISVTQMSWGRTNKVQLFEELRLKMSLGLLDLPPDHYLRNDLILTKRRATNDGPKIVHPKTGDGRHCDMAPALALAVRRWIEEPTNSGPGPGTREHADAEALKAKLAHIEKMRGQAQDKKWWETP